MLIRIVSPYFVAGFDTTAKRIAPIIHYMKDWTIKEIKAYCSKKGWTYEDYSEITTTDLELIRSLEE